MIPAHTHTHTHTLSLSLSHTHTHTHTHTRTQTVVTRRTSAEPRTKRPVSLAGNNTPDLNSLAQEMTSSDQSESKIARPHTSKLPPPLRSRRSQSALDHRPPTYTRHTPSPTDSQPVTSTTVLQHTSSSSSNEGPGIKSYEQPTISSSAKSSRPGSSNSHYRTRQSSFGSQTNLSSTASNESFKHDKKKSVDMIDGVSGSGRATPTSSGRSTPVSRSGKKGRDSIDGTVTSTTGKFGSGLPPRTPYR